MGVVPLTVVPWRGHASPEREGERVVKRLDADSPVCVVRDGLRGVVAARYVVEDDLVCFGCLYRVAAEPQEQDAAKAAE